MTLVRYSDTHKADWNVLVGDSRNGTFLFNRSFMDYHADRFVDVSLMFFKGNKLLAVFPATLHENGQVVSHGGLTYGGFVLSKAAHATDVAEMIHLAVGYYQQLNCKKLVVKPVPSVYHTTPADDELYWLFRMGATLVARSLSTAIHLTAPLPFSTLRVRKVKKAEKEGIRIRCAEEIADYQAYWNVLEEVLSSQHNKRPVHTISEILLLRERFPQQIKLYVATLQDSDTILAGSLLFLTRRVVHSQYIAASSEGRNVGALDLLFERVISISADAGYEYFDFGISTETNGTYLNEGLNFQKEGYGGRSIVYDAYELEL